jgi:hypothetical protein
MKIIYFVFLRTKWHEIPFLLAKNSQMPKTLPKVLFICPTCNDFTPHIFAKNILQDYANIEY